jgi:uncharacterized protein (DUF2062 family)
MALMAKALFKRYLPQLAQIKDHPKLQFFGSRLHDPRLWHFNRHSLAGGMGVGLFAVFLPMPLRMFPSAALSIFCRVNLPLAVSLVWLSNPVTIIPIVYAAYYLGTRLLGETAQLQDFTWSSAWMLHTLSHAWLPFLIGSFMMSAIGGIVGYFGAHLLWRWHVWRAWKQRQQRRAHIKQSLENSCLKS